MQATGFNSLFAIEQLAIMGLTDFIATIPKGYRLAKKLVKFFVEQDIDVLIIIDGPEFNHPVARWLRARKSQLPIYNLVAPTVWAWRAGRAKKMKSYVNEVLAVLPFEPRVFAELDGPPCTFVGHPAIDRAKRNTMTGKSFRKKYSLHDHQPVLVLLPGSRRGEVSRHMKVFAQTLKRFSDTVGNSQIVMPVMPQVKSDISLLLQDLQMDVLQIEDEGDKWGAFRAADLALAVSGTVTLELTAAHTPMVVAYRLDRVASYFRWLVKVHSVVLPNLIMRENIVPEFIGNECTPEALSSALIELYQSERTRDKQQEFLKQAAVEVGSNDQLQTAERAALTILKRLNLEPD